jgi:diaminohydroxyphosphoribosylaminopyrimidine deaminase/5-amino-6-(5-phosphoribosylamino)uracil reductase
MVNAADMFWMALALEVARSADPTPNPRVGAIVVADDRLVSLSWHARAGGKHAEAGALAGAEGSTAGATLYVTLEPCNHFGRTAPCVDAILRASVARVVVGCRDPNPNVAGRGVERLQAEGVEVAVGMMAEEARRLIDDWRRSFCLSRPTSGERRLI